MSKLRFQQSDDVAEGCGRCVDSVASFTVSSTAFQSDWALQTMWHISANPLCVRLVLMKHLRHMRTTASLKIASVIQPGRRWDSPTKLTSPIFLNTFTENNGIFQVESGSGCVSDYSGLFITSRSRWAWTHGKTTFWEVDWKGGALEIMDVCALCNLLTVAAAASCTQESRNADMT